MVVVSLHLTAVVSCVLFQLERLVHDRFITSIIIFISDVRGITLDFNLGAICLVLKAVITFCFISAIASLVTYILEEGIIAVMLK